jgi:hypothetical protein
MLKEEEEPRVRGDTLKGPSSPTTCECCTVSPNDENTVDALMVEKSPEILSATSTWKGSEGGWTCVRTVMDSGAVDSVAPTSMAPGARIVPSPGSIRGQNYLSASNERIPNLGQQTLEVRTDEGAGMNVTFQMADVSRPLNSVGKVCDNNKRVIFGKRGGVIWDMETNELTKFGREPDGVYELNLWIRDGNMPSGFARQE